MKYLRYSQYVAVLLCLGAATAHPKGESGPVVLTDEPRQVMLDFLADLRAGDWNVALDRCSLTVRNAAEEYANAEPFFRSVLPLRELLALQEFPVCGSEWKGGVNARTLSYRCLLRRPIHWVWSVDKTESGWLIDFQTKPMEVWEEEQRTERKRRKAAWELRQRELDAKVAKVSTRLTPVVGTQFASNDFIPLRLELVNKSDSVLWYDDQQAGVNASLTVTDSEGLSVPYHGGSYQTLGMFRPIKPDQSVVLFDNFDLQQQYNVRSPGKYLIQFNGSGLTIGQKPGDAPRASRPSCTTNRFPSNVVTIEIVP